MSNQRISQYTQKNSDRQLKPRDSHGNQQGSDKASIEATTISMIGSRLHSAQRRSLTMHIGKVTGNTYLQQALTESDRETNIVQRICHDDVCERELVQKIVLDQRTKGGITVATYAHREVPEFGEFSNQANQYARDHEAIGLTPGNAVDKGVAMQLDSQLATKLELLRNAIQTLLSRHPDVTNSTPIDIRIQSLAIFTHGERNALEADADRDPKGTGHWLRMTELADWVSAIAPHLAAGPRIVLFACSTAGGTPPAIPFAEALRRELQTQLQNQYGPETQVSPEVWGHRTAHHTVRTATLTQFQTGGSAPLSLMDIATDRLIALALTAAGRHASDFSSDQQQRIRNAARGAAVKVLTPPKDSGETRPANPALTYFREIPQMGIDRFLNELFSENTPDFSDLELTPQAVGRMQQGLVTFRGRFRERRNWLVGFVRDLDVAHH